MQGFTTTKLMLMKRYRFTFSPGFVVVKLSLPPPKYVGYTVKMTLADMDTDRLVLISKLASF